MITQARVKELLHYNPLTGVFVWRVNRGGIARAGTAAGSVCKITGYRKIYVSGKNYQSHRIAWLYMHGEWPDQIDHINHNRADNTIENLRSVDRQANQRNQSLQSGTASGITGVYPQAGKWRARIKVNGKQKSLGYYDTIGAAIDARRAAEATAGYHENHGRAA